MIIFVQQLHTYGVVPLGLAANNCMVSHEAEHSTLDRVKQLFISIHL